MRKAEAELLASFERALKRRRLHMVYQPKVSLHDGKLKRVEALVRWDDPELGTVEPSRSVRSTAVPITTKLTRTATSAA